MQCFIKQAQNRFNSLIDYNIFNDVELHPPKRKKYQRLKKHELEVSNFWEEFDKIKQE